MSRWSKTAEQRFFEKVDGCSPRACWLWTGALCQWGYGRFWLDAKNISAHRFAYQHFVGAIAPGLVVMHDCDTPRCVNPAHLKLGTPQENSTDCARKGRTPKNRRLYRLMEPELNGLRRDRHAGMTMVALARKYGITLATVRRGLITT